jgi:hypothetical protein
MTFSINRSLAAVACGLVVLGAGACGGDDDAAAPAKKPTAAKPTNAGSCAKSWNANANAIQQSTLAGVVAADPAFDGPWRVGMWPKGSQTVTISKGFGGAVGKATIDTGSCLIVLPGSRYGQMAFAQSGGKWVFVAEGGAKFSEAASKAVAGVRTAEPDALGKLRLS